jgi:hypothetical protein
MTETEPKTEPPLVQINAVRVTRWLAIIVVALAVAAVVMAFLGPDEPSGLVGETLDSVHRLFNPDLEANLATWFSTGLLLVGALLTALVAKTKVNSNDALRYHWIGLSAVVLLMSIDEAAQIHEMLIKPTQELLGAGEGTGWVWTIPALVVVVLFIIASVRLVRAQSQHTRRLLILAFGLFFLGAFGVEAIGGILFGSDRSLGFELAAAVEEFFEMSGAVVFIYAILGVLASMQARVTFADTES